jgi:rhamnosyl/mannosyltransferase
MKALHFGRFYGENFGGLERHVALLLKGLSRSAHVDNLVANEGLSSEVLLVDRYRVFKVPSLGLFAGMALCPTMPYWARKLHYREHYDIVHLHFPDPMSHLAAMALPKDVRLVISWHSDIVRQQNLLKLYRPLLDRIIARADAIIAATPRHFSSSTQLGCADPARLHVVPYGIDFAPFEEPSARVAGDKLRVRYPGRKIIFAVGRHVYYKGFEYLIRAMMTVRQDALLILGGVGPLSGSLRALAAAGGVENRVVFAGRIPDEELPAYYHAADVFCLPSIEPSEAFGLVQVEAMACGKPVVCCELGNGVSYVNQHEVTGLVVPPRDPEALAEALNRLLDDSVLRQKMGEAGHARAENEFTLERMWWDTLAIYQKVAGSRVTSNGDR